MGGWVGDPLCVNFFEAREVVVVEQAAIYIQYTAHAVQGQGREN